MQDTRSLQRSKRESGSEQGLGPAHRMPATARSHQTLTVNESEGPQEHDSGQPEGARVQPGWGIRGISSQRGRRRWTVLRTSDLPFSQRPLGRSHYCLSRRMSTDARGGHAHMSERPHKLPLGDMRILLQPKATHHALSGRSRVVVGVSVVASVFAKSPPGEKATGKGARDAKSWMRICHSVAGKARPVTDSEQGLHPEVLCCPPPRKAQIML